MAGTHSVVTWRWGPWPSPVIEVLQSCPNLLAYLCSEPKGEATDRPLTRNKKLFILFPGNPGIVQFYEKFVELLSVRGVDLLVMGYSGHTTVDHNNGKVFNLRDQIYNAKEFLGSVLQSRAKKLYGEHIYIGGHSIGAFIATKVLPHFACIRRCFSLCGVLLRIKDTPNGRWMAFLCANFQLYLVFTSAVWVLLSVLPKFVISFIIRRQTPSLPPALVDQCVKHRNVTALMNCLCMAREELQHVGELDREVFRTSGERMVFYCVEDDRWAPPAFMYEILEVCKGGCAGFIMEQKTDVIHAWCLDHNEDVIENGVLPFLGG